MTPAALERYLAAHRRTVERALRAFLKSRAGRPAQLGEAMRYAVLGPGKRVRPVLALASAEVVGGAPAVKRAVPFACALEMIHAYSLVHDDLPAMDDDDERRGRPSLHIRFGEALAILAGDALLTEAFAVIADALGQRTGGRGAACAAHRVRGRGSVGTRRDGRGAGGRSRERGARRRAAAYGDRDPPAKDRCSDPLRGARGGIAAGATTRQLASLTAYGEALGLAFQIADDILDATHASALIGRSGGGDRARGKATYPGILGVDGARRRARDAAEAACAALRPFGAEAAALDALVRHVVERAA